mgnify:CR=1 FL=1
MYLNLIYIFEIKKILKYVKDTGIVNKAIVKLIVGLMIFKAMLFAMIQIVNTYRYNKKLFTKWI